ncbi:ATP-binding protein [Candidatus Gracilibacteria bacterium]|nr:ATP-binding protein [Candidatus Gracilibacteria bacterium]
MFKRKILEKIELFLDTNDILLFYGARQVGKTSLMKIIQQDYIKNKDTYFFDLENPDYLKLLNQNPNIFIEFLKSYYAWKEEEQIVIFIDEVQYLDNPTNFLKYIYDNFPNIKMIISGSSTLEIRGKLADSLVGRIIKFDILPLSFEEFLIFKQKNNLASLIGKVGKFEIIDNEIKFFYEEFCKFGAYPKVVLANDMTVKKEYLKQIYSTYIEKDIRDIGKIRQVEKFNNLLKVLANQSGNIVNFSEISNTLGITIKTLNEWLFLLENTFVIKIIKPFSTNLRGEITKMPKIFFIDNGLRNFIENDFENITGNSFENSFFNYIHNAYKAEKINFYRTADKKEIDFILDKIPYELKLSYNGKKLIALDYFQNKYDKVGNVICLKKSTNPNYNVFFPWEV